MGIEQVGPTALRINLIGRASLEMLVRTRDVVTRLSSAAGSVHLFYDTRTAGTYDPNMREASVVGLAVGYGFVRKVTSEDALNDAIVKQGVSRKESPRRSGT